jgi:CubicO group peptidase (beta-lactamase class C family)
MKDALVAALSSFIVISAACAGGGESGSSLYSDVWAGRAGGDTFAFQFFGEDPDGCPGVIHCLRDGKKYSEVPMGSVEWSPPHIDIFVEVTGVTYSGTMEDGVIRGGITSRAAPPLSMDLVRTSPDSLPGLAAMDGEYVYSPPESTGDGIPVGSCLEAGIPRVEMEELVSRIADGEAGVIHSILVFSGGRLVLEEYFHGYSMEDLHRLASCTKSVSSLLVGIALDRGLIDSVTVPLVSYFPGADPVLDLRHLLTMSMGLDWTDEEAEHVHGTGHEMFDRILAREAACPPGGEFRYVNADVNLLSGILLQATGSFPDEFAEEVLFDPLGIEMWDWDYGETEGHRMMDGSLRLRPRDMGRIGLLVLEQGLWEGERVISEEWISESTEPRLPVDDLFSYGYLWWLTSIPAEGGELRVILASGWGSQFVAVIPEADIVVVTTGGNDDNGRNWQVLRLVQEVLFLGPDAGPPS